MSERIQRALQTIAKNQSTPRTSTKVKKAWYRLEKALKQEHKIKLHPEKRLGVRRTYKYYKIGKEDWEGPSSRNFSKMSALRFGRVLKGREQSKRETLLEPSPEDTVTSGNVIDIPHDEEIPRDLESHEEIPHDEHVMTAPETHDSEHVLPPDERVMTPQVHETITAEELLQGMDQWDEFL